MGGEPVCSQAGFWHSPCLACTIRAPNERRPKQRRADNKLDLSPLLCRYMFFLGLLMAQFTITGKVARPGFSCLGLVT